MATHSFSPQILPERAVIALKGESVVAFLQNLLTCDLEGFLPGEARYGALLSPQGKILHDMFIFHSGEEVLLDVSRAQAEALIQKLKLYRLRARFETSPRTDQVAVFPTSSGVEQAFADPRNADMGRRAIGLFPELPSTGTYHARRIALGLADSDADLGSNQYFPHEANFDQMNGVSFTKGCYVGQEVVARMQHRGTARNRILPVRISGLPESNDITSGDIAVGQLLSRSKDLALSILRLDRVAEATEPLRAGSADIAIVKPDWINYDIGATS
jgi:tRNA-modifying protein YgfZ